LGEVNATSTRASLTAWMRLSASNTGGVKVMNRAPSMGTARHGPGGPGSSRTAYPGSPCTAGGPGELGFLSQLFCEQPSAVAVVAGEASAVRWIPRADVKRVLLADARHLVLLVRFLGQRLREVQTRERAWAERGVHERVCAALARMVAEQPVGSDGVMRIAATHEQLAARCSVSRPKASLALIRRDGAES